MDSLCIVGASFAYPENCWFELACEKLGLKPMNKAISGTDIIDTAQSMKDNTLFTREELDSFATFVGFCALFVCGAFGSAYQGYTRGQNFYESYSRFYQRG